MMTSKFNIIVFRICTGFLLYLGKILNCTYEKISVLFNLYFQASFLAISGFLPFLTKTYLLKETCTFPDVAMSVILLSYGSIYGVGLFILFKHYPPSWIRTFNLCVNDLQRLGKYVHVSYILINILIFIYWWLSLLAFNFLICFLILSSNN